MAVPVLPMLLLQEGCSNEERDKMQGLTQIVQQVLFSLLQPSQIVCVLGILHRKFTIGIEAMVVMGQAFEGGSASTLVARHTGCDLLLLALKALSRRQAIA